eukprot:SAG31_NODE_324_length_17691_cov_8.128126_8_plen_65_part_00
MPEPTAAGRAKRQELLQKARARAQRTGMNHFVLHTASVAVPPTFGARALTQNGQIHSIGIINPN